jgi:hypothetical protein
MIIFAPIRLGIAVATVCVSAGVAQTLPATPPTTPPAPPMQAQSQPAAQQGPQKAQVELNGGMLTVAADNSSLNQILREISRVTGMKITGGVRDERVYGSYGPADPSTVLSALIRGTGSNMMIVLDERQAPQELVLTPRGGGATPPNPSASRDRGDEDLPPQRQQHFPRPEGVGNVQPIQAPPQPPQPQQQPAQQQPASVFPPLPPPPQSSSTSGETTQQSPNGVKTPQEIYDQLVKMQAQQAAQQQQTPKQ